MRQITQQSTDRQEVDRLRRGVDMALDLGASLEVDDVVQRVLERTAAAMRADRSTLLSLQGTDVALEGAYDKSGFVAGGVRVALRGHPLLIEARRRRQPVVGTAAAMGPLPGVVGRAAPGMRHYMVTPLVEDDEVAGFIVLGRRRDEAFDESATAMLELLGSLATLALHNVRLYAASTSARREMESFLNIVVHELRAPLAVIAGYVDIMSSNGERIDSATGERILSTVAVKTGELQHLVDDLLVAARVESGGMAAQPQQADLCALAEAAWTRIAPRAELSNAAVILDVPDDPVVVSADPDHVARILDNLVNNALNCSGTAPLVRLVVRADDPPAISIEDNGCGVPAGDYERIFERFVRGESAATRGGAGLGLHISRELAQRNGGKLRLAWSKVGQGSRFVLELPGMPA